MPNSPSFDHTLSSPEAGSLYDAQEEDEVQLQGEELENYHNLNLSSQHTANLYEKCVLEYISF
jgi:hypothetical protein